MSYSEVGAQKRVWAEPGGSGARRGCEGRRNPQGWGEDPITSQGPKGAKVLGGDGGAGVSHGGVAKPGSGHLCRCSKAHQTEVILCPGLGYRCGHQEQEDRCEPLTPTARPAVQRSPGSVRVCPHHSSRQSLSTNWSPMASRQLTSAL